MTCLSFLCGRKLDSANRHPEFGDELSGTYNVTTYSYKELKVATNDFSAANKIGEGGFGSVYKGKLRSGQMAAIKVLSSESRQGVREFLTEIKVISEIEHENLVKLYGCCVDQNQRILVYNYLENNSLAQTLLGGGHCSIHFSWRTRVRICVGVARGLAYLHEEVRPHIVHRDIKASNILLDKDLNPRISDFGLAKLIPPNMTHVSTRVAGTIGYLAPEYAIRGQLTRRADIYSFGVLLIEIVSGRCNTNTRLPVDEQYILERTWQLYERKELIALVDTALNGDFDAEQACKFLKIGLLCTQDSPKLRPSMSTVVQMLTGQEGFDEDTITKPGLISDFMDLKIKSDPKPKPNNNHMSSNFNSSLLGTVAFAFFCFYLLLAVIAGAVMLGLKLVFITVHPMKWGATLMNSFLFNVGHILLCSISVIQFCSTAFGYYAQATAAQEIFGHTLQSLRGIKYLYKYNVFQIAFIVLAGLTFVYYAAFGWRRKKPSGRFKLST